MLRFATETSLSLASMLTGVVTKTARLAAHRLGEPMTEATLTLTDAPMRRRAASSTAALPITTRNAPAIAIGGRSPFWCAMLRTGGSSAEYSAAPRSACCSSTPSFCRKRRAATVSVAACCAWQRNKPHAEAVAPPCSTPSASRRRRFGGSSGGSRATRRGRRGLS
jgi:hypothetical protein